MVEAEAQAVRVNVRFLPTDAVHFTDVAPGEDPGTLNGRHTYCGLPIEPADQWQMQADPATCPRCLEKPGEDLPPRGAPRPSQRDFS